MNFGRAASARAMPMRWRLAAAKFVRIARRGLARQSDLVEQFRHPRPAVSARHFPAMNFQRFRDDGSDPLTRIQRIERVLENHLDLAAQRPEFALGHRQDFPIRESDLTGEHRRGRRQLEQGAANGGFARATLADEADRCPLFHGETNVVYRADGAARVGERNVEVFNI